MVTDSATYLGTLTPKFYVALTGTSSLISGIILIFEWWYFRKYGTSFIEQISLRPLGLVGGNTSNSETENVECKVWRNPMSLLRGADYGRLWDVARRAPLTYYDMNLSAQEHQAWFGGSSGSSGADEALARAWREREPAARVACARTALACRPDCAAALLLLAEEDAPTVVEAERVLRRAWRAGDSAWRALAAAGAGGAARREAAVLAHVKRRAAMCARRLGRLREAARLFRELCRDAPPSLAALALHENLLEVLLEQRAFADAQALIARHEDAPSATLYYTSALLRARAVAQATSPPAKLAAEAVALEAIRRAIEFNPHVPEYLLELRALTLPPEHVLRRGDSEALAYAFWHLRHWRSAEHALRLLSIAWQATEVTGATRWGAGGDAGGACGSCADRELLPAHHTLSVFPRPRAHPLVPLSISLCATAIMMTFLLYRWPGFAASAAASTVAAMNPAHLLRLVSAL